MKDDAANSALRRKAGAGRPPPEPSALSPASLLRKAVAQAAEDMHELVATVAGFGESRVTLATLLEGLPNPALLMVMADSDGRRGLAIAAVQIVTALVEHRDGRLELLHWGDLQQALKCDRAANDESTPKLLRLPALAGKG